MTPYGVIVIILRFRCECEYECWEIIHLVALCLNTGTTYNTLKKYSILTLAWEKKNPFILSSLCKSSSCRPGLSNVGFSVVS